MKKLKFLDITAGKEHSPLVKLYIFLAKKYSWPWEFSLTPEFNAQDFGDADIVHVDLDYSLQFVDSLTFLPSAVRSLGAFDSMERAPEQASEKSGAWLPRILSEEILRTVLVKEAKELNNRIPGFIVGGGAAARLGVAVLSQLGLSTIYLVDDHEAINDVVKQLQRSYVGVKLMALPFSELNLRELSGGILINTLEYSSDPDRLSDLSYFNYLKNDAFVVDICAKGDSATLTEEAEVAGLRFVSLAQIFEISLTVWNQFIEKNQNIRLDLSTEDIEAAVQEFYRQNSPSV